MDKKEMAAKRLKERTQSKTFKLPEGTTTFRVLPNKKGTDRPEYIEYRMHSNVGARKAYLRCGKKISGEGDCWLCDTLIPKLAKSGKSVNRKNVEEMKAKDHFAVQIIYQLNGKWTGPTLWAMTKILANKLLGVMTRRDVSHPEKGYNLSITRTGTTMTSTEYSDIDRDDDKSAVPEKFLDRLQTFGEVLKQYDEAVQKREYFGHEQDEEEEEEEEKKPSDDDGGEEEEEPKPKTGKKPSRDEEEESAEEEPVGEEEEPTEEEEEEPKPKTGKKPSKPSRDEEEEGESTDDDDIPSLEDEEEDEKPKPKSGKGKPKHEEEEEESEPEEEEDEPKPKKGKGKPSRDEEEEESTEEEEETESKPKSGKKPSKPADDDDE